MVGDRAAASEQTARGAAGGAKAQIKPLARRNPMPAFDKVAQRRRNKIERFFSKAKQFRAVATRYEKHDEKIFNLIHLASIHTWLLQYESVA